VFTIKRDYSDLTLDYGVSSLIMPLMRYMLNITAGIMLYIIISNEVKTYKEILNCIWVFVLSIFYVFVTWIGSFVFNFNLPYFLQTKYAGRGSNYNYIMRFAGYVGEYGLQSEYFMFIIAFSVLLILSSQKKLERKLVPFIAILISIPMAISTGTRAFLIVIFLFAVIFVSLISFKKSIRLGKRLLFISSIFIVFAFLQNQMRGSFLLERATESVEIGQSMQYVNDIDRLLNRPYIEEFNNIIETGGLFGVGPLNIIGVKGNIMCWHSLYYDILIKFGILGFLIYIFFYLRLLSDLYKNIRLKGALQSIIPIVLFSLFLPLLIGEYARSYQNQTSFMLMYWFLFSIVACVNKMKPDLVLKNKNYQT
jgi:oligosaccharide repeat unit polymerase